MSNERRPLLGSEAGLGGGSGTRRRTASVLAGLSICLLLTIAVVFVSGPARDQEVTLSQLLGEDVDAQYLKAESSGESGKAFIKKLQDMWFVAKYRLVPGDNAVQKQKGDS